jgi:hypothetical protein
MRLASILPLVVVAACLWQWHPCAARSADIDLSLLPQSKRIVYGDPLYLELTLINRTEADVVLPTPSAASGSIVLRLFAIDVKGLDESDSRRVVPGIGGSAAGVKTITLEPGKPAYFYFYVLLPEFAEAEDKFWTALRKGGSLRIALEYRDGETGLGRTQLESFSLTPRDADELRALERSARPGKKPAGKGPNPGDFGLESFAALDKNETAALADAVQTGELADLMRLTFRLQELYELPDEARGPGNQTLARWLSLQPDIMSATLRQQVRRVAKAHGMQSTVAAMDALKED